VLPWPDEHLGQVGCAAVVVRRPVGDAELREHCRARLAGFKVPRRFRISMRAPERGRQDRPSRTAALLHGAS